MTRSDFRVVLTCSACECVERRWPGTVPRARVNRIWDPATIWRRPARMPPAAWRCSRNGVVRFDLDRFGCAVPGRFVWHRWSWPGYRWLERPAASQWSWPTGDATAPTKRDKARKRKKEREKKVISTQHNFLLISLPLALGVAKCQACKLYIYKCICICVRVSLLSPPQSMQQKGEGQGQRTRRTRTQPNRSKRKPHRHLPFLN